MAKRLVVYRVGSEVMGRMVPFLEDVRAAKQRVVEAELRFQLVTDAVLEAFREGKEIPDGVMFDPDRWEFFLLETSDGVQEAAERVKEMMREGPGREGVEGQDSISEVVSQEITGPQESEECYLPEEEES